MTKAELVEVMAKDAGISKAAAAKALSSFTTSVCNQGFEKERRQSDAGGFWDVFQSTPQST